MKLLGRLGKVYDLANGAFVYISAIIALFMVVSISVDVILRYFFNSPIFWAHEWNENLLLYITFLAAAWVLKNEGHVTVEIVTDRLSLRNRHLLGLINSIIGIIVCLIITYFGIILTIQDYHSGNYIPTQLRIPNVFILWVIPLGTFMLAIQFIRRSNKLFQKWKGQKVEAEPIKTEGLGLG